MKSKKCPNINFCRMVESPEFPITKKVREDYMEIYCLSTDEKWNQCKRMEIKTALNFCPDFVLPDSTISTEEVIDRFDDTNED